jgi:HNH endonuclease
VAIKAESAGRVGNKSLLDKLEDKILVGDGCWEWTGARKDNGYGTVSHPGRRTANAHRVVYELLEGPIPEGLDLDHLCRNRGCVKPGHLEAVTRKENLNRGVRWP